jgi:hypothetical protein
MFVLETLGDVYISLAVVKYSPPTTQSNKAGVGANNVAISRQLLLFVMTANLQPTLCEVPALNHLRTIPVQNQNGDASILSVDKKFWQHWAESDKEKVAASDVEQRSVARLQESMLKMLTSS